MNFLRFTFVFLSFLPLIAEAGDSLANTFVGAHFQQFLGEKINSFSGKQAVGLQVLSTSHSSYVRAHYGFNFSYIDDIAYIQEDRHQMAMYSVDAIVGLSIYPVRTGVRLRPFLEMSGLGGFKYAEMSHPPQGVDVQTKGMSFGYRVGCGLEWSLSSRRGLRMTVDYTNNTANIAGESQFRLDSFSVNMGMYF